jgi:hypothetical protein
MQNMMKDFFKKMGDIVVGPVIYISGMIAMCTILYAIFAVLLEIYFIFFDPAK